MEILVTGATGFLGKHLIPSLAQHNITTLTRENSKNLQDKELISKLTKGKDIIIHLAASEKDCYKTNYIGTKNLIENSNPKKFILISSYDITLNTKYGKSKLMAENLLKQSKLNYLILRPTVIYGKHNNKDLTKLINLVKKSPVIPSLNTKLQPLFVEDLVKIIVQGITKNNKEYFIGGPEQLTFNQLTSIISKKYSKNPIKIKIPKFLIKIINKNLLKDKICNNEPILKDFKIKLTKFEQGLNSM